jgi:hypothetical protein
MKLGIDDAITIFEAVPSKLFRRQSASTLFRIAKGGSRYSNTLLKALVEQILKTYDYDIEDKFYQSGKDVCKVYVLRLAWASWSQELIEPKFCAVS